MKIKRVIAALALVFGGFSTTAAHAEAEYTLKLHHMLPPMSGAHRDFIQPWADKVEKDSGGRLHIEIYPAMQLGGTPPQLFDQARTGVVDLIWTVGGYTPGRFPSAGVFELPFMPVSAEITSKALQEYAEQEMQEELKDVHLLAMHTHAPGSLHNREHSITREADLKGIKMRAPNKIMADAMTDLGASPMFMPVTQMTSALSKGVVDSTMLPFEVVSPLKIHELVKYHTQFAGDRGLYTQFFLFVMNNDSYKKLPADLQKVIDQNSGVELAGFIGRAFDKNEQAGLEIAKQRGNTFETLSAEETAKWRADMQPVTDGWIKEMTEAGHDGKALYEKANALINKYSEARVARSE
ncbi:TRAP transporter substrate-binding protein [Parathalassolituus penaei]|uniref:TRAP transporter substrate-binding protein n=1 Tax=Parathalassolituus penaei TaxID=2997323 RepID=A0A9X3EH59_9GAMM|nr:TRAP transporter substrate-binding protein [Parathalassolituus penaei]MCY0967467.1 TRAP transporter substrate-binding protein [Parathalassolituus penaei]